VVVNTERISQQSQLLGEVSQTVQNTNTTAGKERVGETVIFASFHASQEESQPIEAQFEIYDEPSQRTLDTMVCDVRLPFCRAKSVVVA
jgi:hypothetical protein